MLRKRISVLLLVCVLLGLGSAYGYFIHRNRIFPYEAARTVYRMIRTHMRQREPNKNDLPPGMWFPERDTRGLNKAQIEEMEKLASIGYTSGNIRATSKVGVTLYDKAAAMHGLNLYTSGHAAEAILMDMEGRELHKWRYDFQQFWPGPVPPGRDVASNFWRRTYLYPNGDLLAIYEGLGLVKVDKDSKVIWRFRGGAHHDLDVLDDGTIYVLTRQPRIYPSVNQTIPILEDSITVLNPQGKIKKQLSIVKAIESSIYSPLLSHTSLQEDILHTNTLEVLDGRFESKAPFLQKGNVLVSFVRIDTIAIIDMDQAKVVWALSGMFRGQHEPVFLDSGNVLIFDNEGPGNRRSRILEFDIFTQKVFWYYLSNNFYSPILGSNQRLSNGNTLITESYAGRAFEVTQEKRIAWEFRNPHRAGKNNRMIAVIPEMLRLPEDFPVDWLHH